jgi:hypothetical protein
MRPNVKKMREKLKADVVAKALVWRKALGDEAGKMHGKDWTATNELYHHVSALERHIDKHGEE